MDKIIFFLSLIPAYLAACLLRPHARSSYPKVVFVITTHIRTAMMHAIQNPPFACEPGKRTSMPSLGVEIPRFLSGMVYPILPASPAFLNTSCASNHHVTRFAAIQFVMMHVITSLILRKALKSPGIAPQRAPSTIPVRNAHTQARPAGHPLVPIQIATEMLPIVPIRYCPAAPILKSPVLNATATERPVKISGVARKSMFPRLIGLKPNVN